MASAGDGHVGVVERIKLDPSSPGGIRIVERTRLDPPSAGGISQQVADRGSHIALALLIVLNVFDLVLIERSVELGLAAPWVQPWQVAAGRAAILGGLVWSFARRPATPGRLVLVWAAVALSLLAVYGRFGTVGLG